MRAVNIHPLPTEFQGKRFRPHYPPIFPEGEPTDDEIELARALFLELDPESRRWYRSCSLFKDLPQD